MHLITCVVWGILVNYDFLKIRRNNMNINFDAVWLKAMCVLLYVSFLQDDAEFPENIEDFVTLDELDNSAGCDSALGEYNLKQLPY